MPSLPPPPPSEPPGSWYSAWGSAAPPAPVPAADDLSKRPAWRQGRAGWALLHLAIATGLMAIGLIALGFAVVLAGRTQSDIDLADETQTGLATLVLWAGCFVGWFLFAYLRGTPQRRWIALGGAAGGAWLLALAFVLAATD